MSEEIKEKIFMILVPIISLSGVFFIIYDIIIEPYLETNENLNELCQLKGYDGFEDYTLNSGVYDQKPRLIECKGSNFRYGLEEECLEYDKWGTTCTKEGYSICSGYQTGGTMPVKYRNCESVK